MSGIPIKNKNLFRKLAKYLVFSFYGLFIAVLLMEVTLRLMQGIFFEAPDYLKTDAELGTTLRASFHQTVGIGEMRDEIHHNSLGLRGPEVRKDPAALRIFLVGDSYTYGWGTSDSGTVSAQLQKLLNRKGIDAEVLNLGVGGYSTAQSYLRFKRFARLKPDLVVYLFCSNDPDDNRKFLGGEYHPSYPETYRTWWRVFLRRYSLTFQTLLYKRMNLSDYPVTEFGYIDSQDYRDLTDVYPDDSASVLMKETLVYTDSIAQLADSVNAGFMIGFTNVCIFDSDSVGLTPVSQYYADKFGSKGFKLILPDVEFKNAFKHSLKNIRGDVPFMGHYNANGYRLWALNIYKDVLKYLQDKQDGAASGSASARLHEKHILSR